MNARYDFRGCAYTNLYVDADKSQMSNAMCVSRNALRPTDNVNLEKPHR